MNDILMLTTGGTIVGNVAGGTHEDAADVQKQLGALLQPTLDSVRSRWGRNAVGEVVQDEVDNVDSSDIVPRHWSRLAEMICSRYDDFDGFIVTHGTNTMGYTCAALSFALPNLNKPVVVTGSQVPQGQPASDALMNLANAVRVAAYPYEGGIRGVVCVFGSHIISGSRAKKSTDFDLDVFQSFSRGSLGRIGRIIQVNDDNLKMHHEYLTQGANPPALIGENLEVLNRFDRGVLSLTEFPGLDPAVFDRIIDAVCAGNDPAVRGLVFRAFGAGDVSTNLHPCFERLRELGIPVVVTTQAPNGVSNFRVNEPGQMLEAHGLAIPAHDMSIEAITTKLMWLLGQEKAYADIASLMVTDLHGEIRVLPDRK